MFYLSNWCSSRSGIEFPLLGNKFALKGKYASNCACDERAVRLLIGGIGDDLNQRCDSDVVGDGKVVECLKIRLCVIANLIGDEGLACRNTRDCPFDK